MKGTINQDAKTLESRANSIRVSAILKKYTMVIALVVVFIFFTALTGGKMLYAQNISNLLLQNAYVLVMGCGMLLCILTGGNVDLSVGATLCLVGAIAAQLMSNTSLNAVLVILICTSMCAWYITRVKTRVTKAIYILCVFSMVVPFQMVMFTLSLVTDRLGLGTPWGLIIIYLGFGAGLAVFMFCGFVKSIPIEIEEAAMIDGCSPIRTFFSVVLPIMKPTYISVGILETMWIWNDFLLPYLTLDLKKYKTISIVIQYMKGSYGRVDMGAIMAALIMAVIPVIVFYLSCQKYIIKGVAAGAVKG